MTKCQIKRDAWYMHYIIRLCKLYKYCCIHQNYLGSRCTILIVLHLQFKLNCSILLKDKIELESACKKICTCQVQFSAYLLNSDKAASVISRLSYFSNS